MPIGVNDDKIHSFKLELLDYTESINYLIDRLDNCKTSISNYINGAGKSEIISRMDGILYQMPVVKNNINNYISTLDKVLNVYVEQDYQISSQISNDIKNLDRLKEEKINANN